MNKKNIFTRGYQELVKLFESAGSMKKVLCVPLDYAKKIHMALCCNGCGDVLKAPFPVHNTPEGIDFLIEKTEGLCRKHHIKKEHVFFGGEECGTFSSNFIYELHRRGYLVVGVHALRAKQYRENVKASTDILDLLGIGKALLNRQGHPVGVDNMDHLRMITRHRRTLVKTVTALGNRIHTWTDQLCPGFLDEKLSGVTPFSDASLWLMEEKFSPRQIRARKQNALIDKLRNAGTKLPEQVAEKLKTFTSDILPPAPHRIDSLQICLQDDVRLYKQHRKSIKNMDIMIGAQLAPTSGAVLTSIRGTGITLAANLAAEIGLSYDTLTLPSICSYAGIVPHVLQSGGPEKEAWIGGCSRQYNHILKDTILQCAMHIGRHGPQDLMHDYARRVTAGQNKDFGMARRYLRIACCLMRTTNAYIPQNLLGASSDDRRAYYIEMWPLLRRKWKAVDALEQAFDPENPLGIWRKSVQKCYGIKLKFNSNKKKDTSTRR